MSARDTAGRLWDRFRMSKFKKTLKAVIVAGACGIGLCALARKLHLSRVVSDFAQSVEAVPFPGTRFYSFLAAKQLQPLYSAIADQIADRNSFTKLLDIGTGAGYLPIELARRCERQCLIGIDESPDMIRIAKANSRAFGTSDMVVFRLGSSLNLPYPGRYFDRVVSVNVLHHWSDPLAVFEEVYHILEPGGQFWIYDYRTDVPEEVWGGAECSLSPLNKLALQFGPMAASRFAYDEDALLSLASKAHFTDPEVETVTLPLFGCDMPVFLRTILHKPAHSSD